MNDNEEKKSIWDIRKNKIKKFLGCKKIFCINAGLFLTGLILCIISIDYVSNNLLYDRMLIACFSLSISYVIFPIDRNKKDKIIIKFATHFILIISSLVMTTACLQYYFLEGTSKNFGLEIFYAILSLLVLSYISYILINFGSTVHKVFKKVSSKSKQVDENIKNATNKLDGLNNLIVAITKLATSITPIVIAVLAFMKGGS